MNCAVCRQALKEISLSGDILSILAGDRFFYCENKACSRVFLVTVGGFKQEQGSSNIMPTEAATPAGGNA